MEDKDKIFDLSNEDSKYEPKKDAPKPEKKVVQSYKKMTKGKVAAIRKVQGYILVDVGGTGQRTPYIEERHSNLKIGDPIEF